MRRHVTQWRALGYVAAASVKLAGTLAGVPQRETLTLDAAASAVLRGQAYHCASEAGDVLADTLMKELQRDMADAEGALLRQQQQQQQGAQHERPQVGPGPLRAAAPGGRPLRLFCCLCPPEKRAL